MEIFKYISGNQIGAEGATKLGENFSKLLNLSTLFVNIR